MAVKDFFDNLNGGARWDVGVSINRSNSLPLDANSVFASLEAAQNYAAGNPAEGTLANAYPGQVLAVVTDAETIIYYIDANMTLQPVGNTKEVMEYIGNIPEGSDAKTIIEYINAKTEGIATDAALGELQKDVDALEVAVNGKAAVGEEGAEGYEPAVVGLVDEIANIKTALDGKQAAGDYAAEEHTHVADDITNLDDTIKAYNYATKDEAKGYADAKDEAIGAAKKAGDDAAEALNTYKGDMVTALAGKQDVIPENTYDAYGAAAKALEDAQKYADDNDANTTYTIGYESKVDGEGGHPARIVLTPSEGEAQYVDATPFIKDGMIEKVELSEDGLKIVITWNTDADKGENNVTEIPLGELVDVYTGVDGTTIKVEVSNKNEISAEVKTGVIKDGHIASDAAIAKGKLAEDVQASLGLADSALQEADITDLRNASHTHEFVDSDVEDAIAKKHEHTFDDNDVEDAIAKKHEHTFYDNDVEDAIAKKHEHTFDEGELNKIGEGDTDKWNAAEAKAHEHDNKTLLDAITDERVAKWDEAEKNLFDVIDTNYFEITLFDDLNQLTLKDIDEGKISGLTNKAGETATLADVLAEKVDKVEGSRLITSDEASKLEKLVLGENGEVTVSGKVAAGNVDGLDAWITARAGTLEGLSENNLTDTLLGKLNGIEAGAQVNVIEGITFNGATVSVGENKIADITYTLPIANEQILGGVKSCVAANHVTVKEDGTMEVNHLSIDKLVQGPYDQLILNGGGAALI